MSTNTATAPAAAPVELEAPTVPACGSCGVTLAPNGACLELGACLEADTRATRHAARSTAGGPAAWTVSGGVD